MEGIVALIGVMFVHKPQQKYLAPEMFERESPRYKAAMLNPHAGLKRSVSAVIPDTLLYCSER